jgi:DNA-binding transcriptional regulator GbsR (MarR family)
MSCPNKKYRCGKCFSLIDNDFFHLNVNQEEEDDDAAKKTTTKDLTELKEMSTKDELANTTDNAENRPLTKAQKEKRDNMEKSAGWWSKYYASKAKLVYLYC